MMEDLFTGSLKIKRPIIFFDLETTGTNVATDRIVQICTVKISPDGTKEVKDKLVNPTIPIPEEATLIHGIRNEDVSNAPTFKNIAKALSEYMHGCDLGGYNILGFDVALLVEEFLRAGILDFPEEDTKFIDGLQIFREFEPRTLAGAMKFYCNKIIENAHDAKADTLQTVEVLMAQIQKYDELDGSVESLTKYNKQIVDFDGKIGIDKDGDYIYNIGKDKGTKIKDNKGFARWMLDKDFTLDTKNWIRKILKE